MALNIAGDAEKTTEQLKESLEQKIQLAENKLDSISKKIKQSQVEVDKLAQRQVANSAKIRNIKENTGELSPVAVRDAFEEALDAQQRLFVMRGQMDKFKGEQVHLQDFIMQMQDISTFLVKTPLLEGGEVELNAAEVIESVIQAQEAERHKLSSKMHDGPAQALSNFILQAEIAQRLFDMDLDQAREELRHYIEALTEQNETEIHFSASGTERRFDGYLEIMLFRAVQELVSNAARHSKADTIRIHIDTSEEKIVVDVEDDGKGFNVEQAMESSMGIKVIKDRVEILKGTFNVDTAVGQGTRVGFTILTSSEGQDVFA